MNRQPGRQVAGRRKELDRVDWGAEGKGVFEGVGKYKLYRPSPVLWSRSVFERLRFFFSTAPAPIKSRLSAIKISFDNIPPSLLEKFHLLLLLVLVF